MLNAVFAPQPQQVERSVCAAASTADFKRRLRAAAPADGECSVRPAAATADVERSIRPTATAADVERSVCAAASVVPPARCTIISASTSRGTTHDAI